MKWVIICNIQATLISSNLSFFIKTLGFIEAISEEWSHYIYVRNCVRLKQIIYSRNYEHFVGSVENDRFYVQYFLHSLQVVFVVIIRNANYRNKQVECLLT
jgi:hypothetical protein